MDIKQATTDLEQFRTSLYQNFENRADTLMDLLDAMCSMPEAKSVVEYSLSSLFRRSYSTLFKGIAEIEFEEMWLPHRLAPYLPRPQAWPFWLLMVDVTPAPRLYAHTLADRSMVYQPEVVKGKLPVTIGHQYSAALLGLEVEEGMSSSWVLPLLNQRVSTKQDKELVGGDQITALLRDKQLPFGEEFTVEVADSSYSKPAYLYNHRQFPNLVSIVRARGTRVFYRQYESTEGEKASPKAGHPTWYGERFALADSTTWGEPDDLLILSETSRRGKVYQVEVQAWHNLLMHGKNKPVRLPMHEHPFTLVRIVRYDEDGKPAFKHPLWLIVMGERRHELTLLQIQQAYTSRFDEEHFFRFGKQKLLLADFQTPEVQHEEHWWQLVHIAYAQLWMTRHLADVLPNPWERYLPAMKKRLTSPTLVQRDFERIIRQLGTPAQPPRPRVISPGRRKGTKLPKRPRQKVVVKSQIAAQTG